MSTLKRKKASDMINSDIQSTVTQTQCADALGYICFCCFCLFVASMQDSTSSAVPMPAMVKLKKKVFK